MEASVKRKGPFVTAQLRAMMEEAMGPETMKIKLTVVSGMNLYTQKEDIGPSATWDDFIAACSEAITTAETAAICAKSPQKESGYEFKMRKEKMRWKWRMGHNYLQRSGIIIIHLLGLAPAGCLAAPDNGPQAGYRGSAAKHRKVTVVTLCY
jgi:hypothetical protein